MFDCCIGCHAGVSDLVQGLIAYVERFSIECHETKNQSNLKKVKKKENYLKNRAPMSHK